MTQHGEDRISVAIGSVFGFLAGGTAGLIVGNYVSPGANRYERGIDSAIIGVTGAALGSAIGAVLFTPDVSQSAPRTGLSGSHFEPRFP